MARELTEREKLIVYVALNYAQVNVDDVNDAFCWYDEDDESSIDGRVEIGGKVYASFDAVEFMNLLAEFSPTS